MTHPRHGMGPVSHLSTPESPFTGGQVLRAALSKHRQPQDTQQRPEGAHNHPEASSACDGRAALAGSAPVFRVRLHHTLDRGPRELRITHLCIRLTDVLPQALGPRSRMCTLLVEAVQIGGRAGFVLLEPFVPQLLLLRVHLLLLVLLCLPLLQAATSASLPQSRRLRALNVGVCFVHGYRPQFLKTESPRSRISSHTQVGIGIHTLTAGQTAYTKVQSTHIIAIQRLAGLVSMSRPCVCLKAAVVCVALTCGVAGCN